MNLIPIEQIIVRPHRQRQEFDINAHQELVTSISETKVGLQNALVLRKEPEGCILLSGERRLRAIADVYALGGTIRFNGADVPSGQVPCVYTQELSELDAEEAELEENIRRQDLTWAEKAAATARLMNLRGRQAESKGEPCPTVREIAQEVRGSGEGINHEETRRELIITRFLDDPDVKAAKTLDEAFKVVKKKEQRRKQEDLAATVGSAITLSSHKCFHADCIEWMMEQPAEQFDVILTDPPYGMGADEFGDSGGRAEGAHAYRDDKAYWDTLMATWAPQAFRLAKAASHLYAFCDIDNFEDLKYYLKEAGWKVFRTPLVWHKPSGMRTPWVNGGPQRRYELILFARKGDRPVNILRGDVLEYSPDGNLGHSAQKPVGLYRDLLERSALPGDRVLDTFCGTGVIFPAATAVKCLATGVEMDAAHYGIAVQRLKEQE